MIDRRLARAATRNALALALLLAALRASAADLVLPFGVPNHGRLELAVPEGWSVETKPIEEPGGLAMRLGPVDGPAARVLVTALAPPKAALGPEALRAGVESNARELQRGAVEERVEVQTRSGPAARLLFVSATDKRWQDVEPPEGEWRHVTQGVAATGELLLVFTILHNTSDAPTRARALDMVASARHLAPGNGPTAIRVGAAGRTLAAELPRLEVARVSARPGGGGAMVTGSLLDGFFVTLTVEETPGAAGPDDVRELRWTRGAKLTDLEKADVRLSSRAHMALVSYVVPRVDGVDVRQHHVHAYLLHEGVAGEVHLSKVRYAAKDAATLDRVLSSVRLE